MGGSVAAGGGPSILTQAIAEPYSSWGYVGERSPETWGDLSPEYAACGVGTQQSPIDLRSDALHGGGDALLETVEVAYHPIPLQLHNNSHTIQVDVPLGNRPSNTLRLDGEKFELLQFHFHHPSEHTLSGGAFPMELHFVHRDAAGNLAVLGLFIVEGTENAALRPVWDRMPNEQTEPKAFPDVSVNLASLLPAEHSLFRYFGSLTTPPCSELVRWVILQAPIEASAAQIKKFERIFPLNARPVQPQNRQFLL